MDQSRRSVASYWRWRMVDAATSDEDKVTPVYKLEEICDLLRSSHPSIVKEVSEFILKRLDHKSPIVKHKALRVIKYAVGKSGAGFRREMQRNSVSVRQLIHYRGQPDPLKGDALNKSVRETAHETLSALFASDEGNAAPTESSLGSRIQGFSDNSNVVIQCSESPQASLREKANKVLSLLDGEKRGGGVNEIERSANALQPSMMPDLLDTSDSHDLLGVKDSQNAETEPRTANVRSSTAPLIDDLLGDSFGGGDSTNQVVDDDPFADVSFHSSHDKEHEADFFSGMAVNKLETKEVHLAASRPEAEPFDFFNSSSEITQEHGNSGNDVNDLMGNMSINGNEPSKKQSGSTIEKGPENIHSASVIHQENNIHNRILNGEFASQAPGINAAPMFPMGAMGYNFPAGLMFNPALVSHAMNNLAMGNLLGQPQFLAAMSNFQQLGHLQSSTDFSAAGPYVGNSSAFPDVFNSSVAAQPPTSLMNDSKREDTKAFGFISDHMAAARDPKHVAAVAQRGGGERRAMEEDDAKLVFETSKGVEPIMSFDEMGLKDDLLRGIYKHGFEKPSAIQQRAVLPIISGRNVIAMAQSGTGKTSMIAIAVCQIADTKSSEIQALILSLTRESASQTKKMIMEIGEFLNIQAHALVGGRHVGDDVTKVEHGVQVVSGTPARILDLLKRPAIQTRSIKLLILDNFNEMLEKRGFMDQIYQVYKCISPEIQIVLIFATLPKDPNATLEMTSEFMRDPVHIILGEFDELTQEKERIRTPYKAKKYKGVTRHKKTRRFEVHFYQKGKQVYLGAFDDEEDAARVYDLAALKYQGSETLTNFPVAEYAREIEEMQNVPIDDYIASLKSKRKGFFVREELACSPSTHSRRDVLHLLDLPDDVEKCKEWGSAYMDSITCQMKELELNYLCEDDQTKQVQEDMTFVQKKAKEALCLELMDRCIELEELLKTLQNDAMKLKGTQK